MKRVFLIVLDSCGAGELPDAAQFGDHDVNTIRSCTHSVKLHIPNLVRAGIGNIPGLEFLGETEHPTGAVGRLAERSMGKDTTVGHWEIAGIVTPTPLPTYPNGFPESVLGLFREQTGRGVLANAPWSGTEVIQRYGDEHVRTGDLIVYTSADSVFQIAAHEDVVPLEQLYEYCRCARRILQGEHGVGRVVARPFVGSSGKYIRTANRHDFSLVPPQKTMLDAFKQAGLASIAVGKVFDIFAGQGITEHVYTSGNTDGMVKTMAYADRDFTGLCFVNLVDFDMLYGHRRDVDGYATALTEFDNWLVEFLKKMGPEDLVIITADHGCDPGYLRTTDHTREYIPFIALGRQVKPGCIGTRSSFSDIAATICDGFSLPLETPGKSFLSEVV